MKPKTTFRHLDFNKYKSLIDKMLFWFVEFENLM